MAELYQGVNSSLTTLSDDTPPFDSSFYDAVVEELYGLGGYTPEYLTSDNGAALINETYDILSGAVKIGLNEEVDPNFKEALENNVFIFSGFKTHQELEEVNALLRDENGNLKPFDQFKLDVLKINEKYNVNYLQAEYNMAVQSAQMASKWKDFEAHKDFVNLQYRTAGDDRVRAEHQALNGTTLPVEDAFWKEYLPPLGWNCRCTVVEVLKDSVPVSNSEQAIKAGELATSKPAQKIFRFNPGITKQVFPPKHPYYKVGGRKNKEEVDKTIHHNKMINEVNKANYTQEEKEAIVKNNEEVEEKLGLKKGWIMNIADADRQKANPRINENLKFQKNCAVCTGVYLLRRRGFNIIANEKNEHLSIYPFDKWRNIDGSKVEPIKWKKWFFKNTKKGQSLMTPELALQFLKENCKEKGIYEIVLPLSDMQEGHATIIEKTDKGFVWVDPQDQKESREGDITKLLNNIEPNIRLFPDDWGIVRIDNKVFNTDFIKILGFSEKKRP